MPRGIAVLVLLLGILRAVSHALPRALPLGPGPDAPGEENRLTANLARQETAGHSAGPQTGQFGRSEAEAKLHRLGLDLI